MDSLSQSQFKRVMGIEPGDEIEEYDSCVLDFIQDDFADERVFWGCQLFKEGSTEEKDTQDFVLTSRALYKMIPRPSDAKYKRGIDNWERVSLMVLLPTNLDLKLNARMHEAKPYPRHMRYPYQQIQIQQQGQYNINLGRADNLQIGEDFNA